MKKILNANFLLLLIILLAFFLRVYKMGQIPASLNPDETALGYNAYSILKTGADEHGQLLPLALKSFGDWKLPGYPFLDIIPVLIFGLTEFAVRLPSAIAGVIGVYLIFKISRLLFGKKEIAIISSFLFALSPWSIYFSRAAYEANVATTFFLGGILATLTYFLKAQKNSSLLIISSVFFGLAIFTYHAYAIFIPFFIIGLIIIFRKSIVKDKNTFIAASLLFLFFIVFFNSTLKDGSNKISTLNIFNDPNIIYSRVEKLRGDNAEKNIVLERIVHNKYLGVSYQLIQNYINAFSPEFLFDKGGEKLVHNLGFFGNLYLFDALLLLVGFAGLFWNRERSLSILLLWVIVGPIASVITKDTPNSTRLFILMPLFTIVASYGAYQIINYFKQKSFINYFVLVFLLFLFILNVVFFIEIYFVHLNAQRIRFWHYGYREAVELTQKYPNYKVVMTGPENFPYIYFLFYKKYDPIKFRKEVVYYPQTNEGFYFVKSFGRFSFIDKIDYNKMEPNTLYIDATMLGDKKHSILLPSGEPIFGYLIKGKY